MKTFNQFVLSEDWWSDMSSGEQDQYKLDHPKSEKAKNARDDKKAKDQDQPDGGKDTPDDKKVWPTKPKMKTVTYDKHERKVGDQYWKKPDAEMISREHDEVATQIDVGDEHPDWAPDHVQTQLKKLKDSGDWEKAMKNAKTINISPDDKDLADIGNTEAGGDKGLDAIGTGKDAPPPGHDDDERLDPEKITRVKKQFKDNAAGAGKDMEKPIILYDKATGYKHLVAGNTRLTYGIVDNKSTVPVTAIEYDSTKMEEMKTFGEYIVEARKYKLFIDDEREPAKIKFDYIVRDYKETMKIFDRYGCPSFISFDHDLGARSKTGFDITKNMVKRDLDKNGSWIPKNFTYDVHSANPAGKKNIEGLLDNYLEKR